MQQVARTTIVDRNASIVFYDELPADIRHELEGQGYTGTMFVLSEDWLALPLIDMPRMGDVNWHAALPMGTWGAYVIHVRDDHSVIIGWRQF